MLNEIKSSEQSRAEQSRAEQSRADIIIPAYNADKTIARVLDSLCCQSYHLFRVIVVNDGSTDQTANIVEEYSDKLNIKLINLEDNAGVANARNIGIENASAKYIFLLIVMTQ